MAVGMTEAEREYDAEVERLAEIRRCPSCRIDDSSVRPVTKRNPASTASTAWKGTNR